MGNIFEITNNFNCIFNCRRQNSKYKMGSEVKDQLYAFHNPFHGGTSQPKIPDGSVTHSLGFSTQSVSEISVKEGEDTMHMLIYPGMNTCLICDNTRQQGSRDYWVPDFNRSGGVGWSAAGFDQDFNVTSTEGYAKWRQVSVGVQLKLLNSVEEDDGWWEAVRVNEMVDFTEYSLVTSNGRSKLDTAALGFGSVAPWGLMKNLKDRIISNDASYMTGLLRDLNRIQFELHPTTTEHPFVTTKDPMSLNGSDYIENGPNIRVQFEEATPSVYDIINNFVDFGMDMIYVRLHCRPAITEVQSGSRFHANLVMNQEIVYDNASRLARYYTRTANIGDGNMDAHNRLRRGQGGAANMVLD